MTVQDVRQSLTQRPLAFDAIVILSFAILFGLITDRIVKGIIRRYPPGDGSLQAAVMIAVVAIGSSAIAVPGGEEWSAMWEGVRLQTGHLSYRAMRLPWLHYRAAVFLLGAVIVVSIAIVRCYRNSDRINPGVNRRAMSL